MTRQFSTFKTLLIVSLFTGAAADTHAETIQQGILSISASAPNNVVAGTVDSGYVTAIFGNAVFIQDATGGVYLQYGAEAASGTFSAGPFYGMTVGTQFTALTGGGFNLYTNYNEFQYKGTGTTTSTTTGSLSSIPVSYFTLTTTSGVVNNQGGTNGSTITQGLQNQLLTIKNATILTSAGDAPAAGAVFAAGRYQLLDSTGTITLYISTGLDLIGQPIPTGNVTVSGVFQEYNSTTQELEPRAMADIQAVPEPSSSGLAIALAATAGALGFRHRRRA